MNKNVENIVKAGIIAVGAIILWNLFFVDKVNDDTKEATPAPTKEVVDNRDYRWEAFRESFVTECSVEANREYCNCAVDYFEDNHGREGTYSIAQTYVDSGNIPEEMYDAADACIQKFD